MQKKCLSDASIIVPTENIGIEDILSYDKIPIQIFDCQIQKLRNLMEKWVFLEGNLGDRGGYKDQIPSYVFLLSSSQRY